MGTGRRGSPGGRVRVRRLGRRAPGRRGCPRSGRAASPVLVQPRRRRRDRRRRPVPPRHGRGPGRPRRRHDRRGAARSLVPAGLLWADVPARRRRAARRAPPDRGRRRRDDRALLASRRRAPPRPPRRRRGRGGAARDPARGGPGGRRRRAAGERGRPPLVGHRLDGRGGLHLRGAQRGAPGVLVAAAPDAPHRALGRVPADRGVRRAVGPPGDLLPAERGGDVRGPPARRRGRPDHHVGARDAGAESRPGGGRPHADVRLGRRRGHQL